MLTKSQKIILLKLVCWLGALAPLLWLALKIYMNALSADPAKDIQHFTGNTALNFLFITLLISPVVYFLHWNMLNQVKRLLGLASFFWAVAHILSYAFLELGGQWSLFFSEVFSRVYLIIGGMAGLGLFLLAVTSPQFMMRWLKKWWKRLHNMVYPIALLAVVHYYLSLKVKQVDPFIYGGILLLFWLVHLYRRYKK